MFTGEIMEGSVKLERRLLELRRLQEQSPVLSFLRSHTLDVVGAFLITYFSDDSKRIDVEELHARISADIESLAFRDERGLRYKPAALTSMWVERGLVARRQHVQTRAEYFELTSSGAHVIDFLNQIDQPLAKATQSRLANLTQMIVSLELETNPDKTQRLAALERRRAEIDREIERVQAGQIDVLPFRQAMENLRDIVDQAREVPSDFLRVRDEFDDINRTLRRDILESEHRQEETLNEVFMGIDHVQSSDAGQSFDAFYGMLLDEERQVSFDAAVQALDDRRLLDQLTADDAALLREYSYVLQREAMPVREVMTTLSRNLRQFVQSRQFQHFKAMTGLLTDIQRLGLRASGVLSPVARLPLEVEFSTVQQQSVGALKLRYPQDERTVEDVEAVDISDLDVASLNEHIRQSEIDFVELRGNINRALEAARQKAEELLSELDSQTIDAQEVGVDGLPVAEGDALGADPMLAQPSVTLGQVLADFPPSQGLASIVGMMFLGLRYGVPTDEDVQVTWRGQTDGVLRCGRMSDFVFEALIEEGE